VNFLVRIEKFKKDIFDSVLEIDKSQSKPHQILKQISIKNCKVILTIKNDKIFNHFYI